jgi:hypothetical protein
LEDPMFGCGWIYKIMFGESPNNRHYESNNWEVANLHLLDYDCKFVGLLKKVGAL